MILASIKPYYYYLIAEEKKKIEVRKTALKNLPQDIAFYMSKDEKSFAKIPKEFQEKYRKHFGKVGLKATCNGGVFMIPLGLRGFEESKETLNAMYLTNERFKCLWWFKNHFRLAYIRLKDLRQSERVERVS